MFVVFGEIDEDIPNFYKRGCTFCKYVSESWGTKLLLPDKQAVCKMVFGALSVNEKFAKFSFSHFLSHQILDALLQ